MSIKAPAATGRITLLAVCWLAAAPVGADPANGWVVLEQPQAGADRRAADSEFNSPSNLPVVEPAPPAAPAAAASKAKTTGDAELPSDGRSYGGTVVTPGTAAWQAEIYRLISDERWALHLQKVPREPRAKWEAEHWCGAALIKDDWVLTAAHCVLIDFHAHPDSASLLKAEFVDHRQDVTVSRDQKVSLGRCVEANLVSEGFRIRLGAADISRADGITFRVDCAVVHPNWNPDDIYHDDIALLHFVADGPPAVRDPAKVREIRMHQGPAPPVGTSLTVTGWGKTKDVPGFAPSAVLMQVALNVQSEPGCASRLGAGPEQLHAKVICAGAPARKTCLGDSGGPVVFTVGKPNYLVGVVSWGKEDCMGDAMPGVYTRVGAYVAWIEDVLQAER